MCKQQFQPQTAGLKNTAGSFRGGGDVESSQGFCVSVCWSWSEVTHTRGHNLRLDINGVAQLCVCCQTSEIKRGEKILTSGSRNRTRWRNSLKLCISGNRCWESFDDLPNQNIWLICNRCFARLQRKVICIYIC